MRNILDINTAKKCKLLGIMGAAEICSAGKNERELFVALKNANESRLTLHP